MPHKRKKKTSQAGPSKTSMEALSQSASKARDSTADMTTHITTTSSKESEAERIGPPDSRTSKRLKINTGAPLAVRAPKSSLIQDKPDQDGVTKGPTACAEPSLAPEIQHLQKDFHFSTMSIISSSKIQQKVKTLLERIKNSASSTEEDRPGVVIMQAKAPAVAKMISIVEIAKTDITQHQGTWYQYSKLRSELLPLKQRGKKSSRSSGTHTFPLNKAAETLDSDPSKPASDDADASKGDINGEEDSEDDVDAFEIMEHQPSRTSVRERARIRATPIVNIYFSSTPIPALKNLHG
ncbi:MAG: hypothetical protein Q9174_000810 [Haloplaca sp. 1 TL-2023]